MRVILEIPEKEEGLYLPAEMLEEAGLSQEDGLSYTIEEGRIQIETAESCERRFLEEDWEDAKVDKMLCCLPEDAVRIFCSLGITPETIRGAIEKGAIDIEGNV